MPKSSVDRAFECHRKYLNSDSADCGPIEDFIAAAIDEAVADARAEELERCAKIAAEFKGACSPFGPMFAAGITAAAELIEDEIRLRGGE